MADVPERVAKKVAKKTTGGKLVKKRSQHGDRTTVDLDHEKPNGHVLREDPALRAVLKKVKFKQRRKTKHDWVTIREFFITNPDEDLTLADVARLHGVQEHQVYKKSKEENWKWLRIQYWTQVLKEKRHRRAMKNADEADKFDDSAMAVAKTGMSMTQLRMGQIATYFQAKQPEFNYAIEKLRSGLPVARDEFFSAINYKELRELAQAALMFQELGHKALGTDVNPMDLGEMPEGALGGPTEQIVSIGDELTRNDPDRIAAMMEALEDAGLLTYETDDKGRITKFDIDGEWLEGGSMGVPGQQEEQTAIEAPEDPNVGSQP